MAVVGMLSWLSSGLAWFVFLNVIVGAIAVVSWLGQGAGGTPSTSARRRLARTASTVVMERLRSVANFPFQYLSGDYSVTPLHDHGGVSSGSDYFYYPREAEEEEEEVAVAQASRVVVQTEAAQFRPEAPTPVREIVAATTSSSMAAPPNSPVTAATAAIKNEEEEAEAEEEEESISLDEAYALAQQAHAQARAPRSAPNAAAAAGAKAADAKPRRARAEEVEEGKAEVNARAERFIQQFREDLKLQRINSIINYTNALRRRGAAGVAATAPAPAR